MLLAVAVLIGALIGVAVNVHQMIGPPLPSNPDYAWRFAWLRAAGLLVVLAVTAQLATAFGVRVWRWRSMPDERVGRRDSFLVTVAVLVSIFAGGFLTWWSLARNVTGPDMLALRAGLIGATLAGLLLMVLGSWSISRSSVRPRLATSALAVAVVISLLAVVTLSEHLDQPAGSWAQLSSYWSIRQVPHLDDTPAYASISCNGRYCMALGVGVDPSVPPVSSSDGGRTWTVVPTALSDQILAFTGATVSCWDTEHCLAAGDSTVATRDGGRTWSVLSPRPGFIATGVACPSNDHCVLFGRAAVPDRSGFVGSVLDTTDGGRTWTTATLPSGNWQLQQLVCPSASVCHVTAASNTASRSGSGGDGAILTTLDGGLVWTAMSPAFADKPFDITCTDTKNCIVLSFEPIAGSSLHRIDTERVQFGSNEQWGSSPFVASPFPASVSCADYKDCLAVSNDGSSAVVFASHDGGGSWYRSATLHGLAPNTVVLCPSAQRCLLAGGQGSGVNAGPHDRGQILLGNDIGVTWTVVHSSAG